MAKDDKGSQAIGLGDRVKDRISGFTGIVYAWSLFLNGCVRVNVAQEKTAKDGSTMDSVAFDIGDLVLLKKGVVLPVVLSPVTASAPLPPAASGGVPTRGPARMRR